MDGLNAEMNAETKEEETGTTQPEVEEAPQPTQEVEESTPPTPTEDDNTSTNQADEDSDTHSSATVATVEIKVRLKRCTHCVLYTFLTQLYLTHLLNTFFNSNV